MGTQHATQRPSNQFNVKGTSCAIVHVMVPAVTRALSSTVQNHFVHSTVIGCLKVRLEKAVRVAFALMLPVAMDWPFTHDITEGINGPTARGIFGGAQCIKSPLQ